MTRKLALVPVLVLSLSSCSTLANLAPDPRGPALGKDYFRGDFQCSSGPVGHEKDPAYLAGYALYREAGFGADLKSGRKARIVLTGDSIAALFVPALLDKYLPEYDAVNRGVGGDTTSLLRLRLRDDVTSLHPLVVIISIGGNDLLNGRCIETALKNTELNLEQLREGDVRIILVSVPPVLSWKANSIVPFYNARLRELAQKKGVGFLDLWPALAMPHEPILREEFRLALPNGKVDTIHFNERGYAVWADLIRSTLGETGKKKNPR